MRMAPIEKAVNDAHDRFTRDRFCGRPAHQIVVTLECQLAVGAEVVLHARDLDHPHAARLAEPRFWKMRHDRTLQPDEAPSELKGSRPSDGCSLPGAFL